MMMDLWRFSENCQSSRSTSLRILAMMSEEGAISVCLLELWRAKWLSGHMIISRCVISASYVQPPFSYFVQPVGSYSPWCCGRRRYMADTAVHYQLCVLQIKRRGHLIWKESQFGSGFDVELVYGRKIRPDGGIIGLTDDYELTRPLARFLLINQDRIYERLETIDADLASYRSHCRKECRSKRRVLTYRFLSLVYDLPQEPNGLTDSSIAVERDSRVRHLMTCNTSVFVATYERFKAVSMSKATQWWYIFWVRYVSSPAV
jgi:hypothetical protein